MKKILIFSCYGGCIPDAVAKILSNIGDGKRTGKVIDEIEAAAVTQRFDDIYVLYSCAKANPDILYHLEKTNIYVGWNKEIKNSASVSISEIDETKKWIIEEYDGAEFIRKLPEYKLIDEELNLYSEKSS